MRKFFRQLSLTKKLVLIGVIPMAFLCYVGFQLYKEKADKVNLLHLYTQRIYQSENLSRVIDALQTERKLSFDKTVNTELGRGLFIQRQKTDKLLHKLKQSSDISLQQFEEYTFLKRLPDIRKLTDQQQATAAKIMEEYTNMIFRLNTLNSSFPATRIYLTPVANDLAAQRLITEQITYLGIIRANIFNVLHTKQYVAETLFGTLGSWKIFHSYENEFYIKAPEHFQLQFDSIKSHTELKATLVYIDTVFSTFRLDSSYTAEEWWEVSDKGVAHLKALQDNIWATAKQKIAATLDEEESAKNQALIFLVLALVVASVFVGFILHIISSMLHELEFAAGKIAKGDADVEIDISSDDAIGSLASSIQEMEKQVRERTQALQESNTELERSNRELEQFAYVASHDLQEPVRKIRTFADHLMVKNAGQLDESGRKYLDKIAASAERMRKIINDLLQFSQLERNEDQIQAVDLNLVLENVKSDLELLISQKNAVVVSDKLPIIEGIPVQLNQLFYNLLNNALKFSKEDTPPYITISSTTATMPDALKTGDSRPARYVKISFTDNGIGFNPEFGNKIFAMFQRLRTDYSGTGIGLALCKKIVENHDGIIEAFSAPGEGSRFELILPLKQK